MELEVNVGFIVFIIFVYAFLSWYAAYKPEEKYFYASSRMMKILIFGLTFVANIQEILDSNSNKLTVFIFLAVIFLIEIIDAGTEVLLSVRNK